jgi:hypothetical protein
MAKAANVCTVLMFLISLPIAYKQLNPSGALPNHWPLILLCATIGISAALQIWAAVLNHKKPKDVPMGNAEVERAERELSEIYGDCIYDWAAQNRPENAPFSADQLAYHLNLSREKIEMGLNYLNSVHAIERDAFGWQIDQCHALAAKFKCVWVIN